MRRSSFVNRFVLTAAGATAAALLAGCSSPLQPDPGTEVEVTRLANAINQSTEALDTYQQDMTAEYPTGADQFMQVVVDMQVDRSNPDEIRTRTTTEVRGEPMTVVIGVGDRYFAEVADQEWIGFPNADSMHGTGLVVPDENTPRTFADSLDSATYEGEEEVDGQTLQKYTAIADPNNDEEPPPEEVPVEHYTLWLDDQERLVRFEAEVGHNEGNMQAEFSGFDEPVEITEPPAEQVTPVGE